jgi:hypothetical protein
MEEQFRGRLWGVEDGAEVTRIGDESGRRGSELKTRPTRALD